MAYNIKARFKIADKEWLSKVFPKLEVNQTLEIESIEKHELGKKGIYYSSQRQRYKLN